jgi:hypothetical protein
MSSEATCTSTPTTDWAGMEIRSLFARRGVPIQVGHGRGLARKRFSPEWVPVLFARSEAMNAKNVEAVVAKWLRTGRWDDQILFAIATRIGLWDTLSAGGRFNHCRKMRKLGLRPWALAAIWNGANRTNGIDDPKAFLGAILKRKQWVRFEDEVRHRESSREITNKAVVSIVAEVIRRQKDKLLEEAWSEK